MYKLTNTGVLLIAENLHSANDPNSSIWKGFQQWRNIAGNIPEPADPPPRMSNYKKFYDELIDNAAYGTAIATITTLLNTRALDRFERELLYSAPSPARLKKYWDASIVLVAATSRPATAITSWNTVATSSNMPFTFTAVTAVMTLL